MQLAISTQALASSTPEALRRAAALGFSQVEVNLRAEEFGYGYRRKPAARFYRDLRQEIDTLGLSVWSVTSTPLTQEQMFSARARKEVLLGSVAAAGILGARVFVVQPADILESESAANHYLERADAPSVVTGFDEGWAQVVNHRMTLALLNRDYWVGMVLTNQVERLRRITEDLAIGCALDVRAAVQRNALAAWLEALGERMAVAYAYDLDEGGERMAPAAGEWEDWLAALGTTRLKCLVMGAHPSQSDDELTGRAEGLRRIVAARIESGP
jgi:sugar phosphate isomerase/epimerase